MFSSRQLEQRGRRRAVFYALFLAWVLGGCSSAIPFTHQLRKNERLNEAQIESLQFFTSHEIVLVRETDTRQRSVERGRLTLEEGRYRRELVIPKGTPGVVVAVRGDTLLVAFDDALELPFVPEFQTASEEHRFAQPVERNHEVLSPARGRYVLARDGNGIAIAGERWRLGGQSAIAHLLVDADKSEFDAEDRTEVDGRRL